MPIYVYKCRKCGVAIEELQKMSDDALTEHESCGGALDKQITTVGVRFKGVGWGGWEETSPGMATRAVPGAPKDNYGD